ncbi:unnamed protein product [Ilex paraguariensis]|uniref:Uncharacterized protein n=1 Tax=Ilex paraguariensis TaxID=185542 RepID=A0ABC8QPY0_9AQUA
MAEHSGDRPRLPGPLTQIPLLEEIILHSNHRFCPSQTLSITQIVVLQLSSLLLSVALPSRMHMAEDSSAQIFSLFLTELYGILHCVEVFG